MKIQWEFHNNYMRSEMVEVLMDHGLSEADAEKVVESGVLYTAEVELDTETMKVRLLSTNGESTNVVKP